MQTPEEVAQANIDAYNAHDVEALIATFSPSATFGQLGGRILLDGRGSMQRYYTQLFHARPTLHCAVKQRTVMGPFVVELQEISGDDQPGMQAMMISEVRDGRIVKVWYSPLVGGPPSH
jgi:hypothetical protein